MKKELLKGFTMLALLVAIALVNAAATVNAQSSNKVVADIPFEFSVGYKTMPAGKYLVQSLASPSNGLLIQSADAKSSAVRLSDATIATKNNSQARLVFHRYGERYFLAQVWSGAEAGRQLLKSHEERAIEQELTNLAANDESAPPAYEIVEVVAVLR
ncbi:MAG TPA: hypothetical protein VGN90_14930 [Pyrinomonadaceae bacterium]|jgi:hypothetical protein|nr:hypothetical protein [Pyrinomonadaceae bacterium]